MRWNLLVDQAPEANVEPQILVDFTANADRPITLLTDDRLRREQFAKALGNQLASAGQQGLVMALTGPWGSGKTSLLNLIADHLAPISDTEVVRFNPWFFSGTAQLTSHFFAELGSQLVETTDSLLKTIGGNLKRYGRLLSPLKLVPVAGTYLDAAGKLAQAAGEAMTDEQDVSLWSQHEQLTTQLAEANKRIVVMVDDIDRLEDDEIRQVMQLVRMVGDFPNVVYLLAFDADRVVRVLSRGGLDGHKYLDKIVQISYQVPEAGREQLRHLLMTDVERVVGLVDDRSRAGDVGAVVEEIIAPLVMTVRDIRRYANVLPFALALVGQEVAVAGILVLEALRLFLPALYEKILSAASILTSTNPPTDADGPSAWLKLMEDLANAAEPHGVIVADLVRLIFPIAQAAQSGTPLDEDVCVSLAKDRRVADAQRLAIYFEKTLPSDVVPAAVFADFLNAISDPEQFRQHLEHLPDPLLEDLFTRLPDALSSVPRDTVAALCAAVLLNGQRLRHKIRDGGVTGVPSVERLIAALLSKVQPVSERCGAIQEILRESQDLNSQYLVIHVATKPRGAGLLVDIACARELTQRLLEKVLSTDGSLLAELPALSSILDGIARNDKTTIAALITLLEDDSVYIQYLASMRLGLFGAVLWRGTGFGRKIPLLVGDFPTLAARLERLRPQLEDSTDPRARSALRNGQRILAMF